MIRAPPGVGAHRVVVPLIFRPQEGSNEGVRVREPNLWTSALTSGFTISGVEHLHRSSAGAAPDDTGGRGERGRPQALHGPALVLGDARGLPSG